MVKVLGEHNHSLESMAYLLELKVLPSTKEAVPVVATGVTVAGGSHGLATKSIVYVMKLPVVVILVPFGVLAWINTVCEPTCVERLL